MSFWNKEYTNISNFANISVDAQQRIVAQLKTPEMAKDHWVDLIVERIAEHLDDKDFVDIVINIIENAENNISRMYYVNNKIEKCYGIAPKRTKEALKASKSKSIQKLLLVVDPNKDEEILGLRAFAGSKSVPSEIYSAEYKMSREAVKELPTIMRLKVLEAFASQSLNTHNVFQNLSREDFEDLLFPSITRYPGRVSELLSKFEELSYLGKESTVEISCSCKNCGPYNIAITTQVYRAKSTLQNTSLGANILNRYCPFCFSGLSNDPLFQVKE